MKRNIVLPLLSVVVLVFASLACGGGKETSEPEGTGPQPATEVPVEPSPTPLPAEPSPTPVPAEAEEEVQGGQGEYDTVFPLPDDVQNFTGGGGEEMVNFQTNLSVEEVVAFYRQAFAEMGLTEREILTMIADDAFSMVFDGWPNGQGLVIQGVDLGESTNVNMRFEDV